MAEINVPNYPGNPKQTPKKSPERKTVESVVKGSVTRRKKSIGRRVSDIFFGDEINVRDYIVQEVVVPSIKGLIGDIFYSFADCVETALFGRPKAGSRDYNRGRRSSPTPYGSFYSSSSQSSSSRPASNRPRRASGGAIDDIIVGTRSEAEEILFALADIIEQYGFAKVSELNDLLKEPGSFTDEYYGWDNLEELSKVKPYRDRDGYVLSLPNPIRLER